MVRDEIGSLILEADISRGINLYVQNESKKSIWNRVDRTSP